MTLEEKRKAIKEYCESRRNCFQVSATDSAACPLSETNGECFDEYADIGRNYEVLFGAIAADNVNHPSHYNQGKFECIDVMVETFGKVATENFCLLNAFKYVWRTGEKNGIEDVEKAIWYLEKIVELETEEE